LLKRTPDRTKKKNRWYVEEIDGLAGNGKGIYYKLNDAGDSLSAGEKQLLCLCRAILRKNKVVVLDEATANIDIVTEQKVYKLIDAAFKGSTLITIAHRLNTVLNSDKVLVLDQGKILEYDEPAILAKNPKSRLSYLLEELQKEEDSAAKKKEESSDGDKKEESTDNTSKQAAKAETE